MSKFEKNQRVLNEIVNFTSINSAILHGEKRKFHYTTISQFYDNLYPIKGADLYERQQYRYSLRL
jgi:hypothetical protein